MFTEQQEGPLRTVNVSGKMGSTMTTTTMQASAHRANKTSRGKELTRVEETLRWRIAERREAHPERLSQSELARRLGVSPSAVNQYESGQSRPTIDGLVDLARELRTSVSYLVGETDYMYPPDDRGLKIVVRAADEEEKNQIIQIINLLKRLSAHRRALVAAMVEAMLFDAGPGRGTQRSS